MNLILRLLKLVLKKDLIFPLILISVYIGFLVIIRAVLPTSEELVAGFETLYKKYGYEILFSAALLEALVIVNLFVPGVVALALGIIFARAGHTSLEMVILVVSAGAILGYMFDYILGFFGFSEILKKLGYGKFLDQAQIQLEKFGQKGLVLSFIHANIASFMSFAAGVGNVLWYKFAAVATLSTLVWVSLWSILIYSFGDIFLIIIKKYTFLLILIIMGIIFLGGIWNRKGEK